MSWAPKTHSLLIAGRLKGCPQISFNVQAIGTVACNVERADVCGPMQANSVKRMMRPQLIRQATIEAIGLADIEGGVASSKGLAGEDVDASDRAIDRSNKI